MSKKINIQPFEPFDFAKTYNEYDPCGDIFGRGDPSRMDDTSYGSERAERERMNNSRGGSEIIAYHLTQRGHYMPLYHSHNYYEFVFVLSEGRIVFSNTGGNVESRGKCVCFNDSHVLHRNNVPDDVFYDRIVLYCGEAALSMIGTGVGTLGKFSDKGSVIIKLDDVILEKLVSYLNELMCADTSDEKKRLLTALILCELKEYSSKDNTRILTPVRTYIKDVAEYIGAHYKEDITTPKLADVFFVSVNKLNRDFKRYTGSSIRQYLIALRMKYAQAMLASGDSTIKTADECGFESVSYFIQAFKAYTGQTPSAFAKKALGKSEMI